MANIELELVNYRCPGIEPMRSITRLSQEEASAAAKALYEQSSCPAHRRFGPDFPGYFSYRLEIESWLYEHFLALGGEPETEHPLYFAVQSCDSLRRNFADSQEYRIRLSDIDPRKVSFTWGDSMAQRERGTLKPPFLLDDLQRLLRESGDVAQFLENAQKDYACIEAQLWTLEAPLSR